MFKNYPVYIVLILVFLYVFIPFLAPVFFKLSYEDIGRTINEVYEPFCHQRVERSIFLFGKESWVKSYEVESLKGIKYLPEHPLDLNSWPEYYGHDFYGDETIGFKVPLCIRDIALYLGFVIAGLCIVMYSERKKKKLIVPFNVLLIFLIPMVVDGVGESIIEFFKFSFVPMWFVNDWGRRIITGVMFGIGCALYIIPAFYWDDAEKEKTKK